MERFDVIVIGAGLAGLLTAAMLGRLGRRVVVLERESAPGGRLRSFEHDGFVVDAGAYLWPNAWLDEALVRAGATSFRGSTIPNDQVMRVFVQGGGGRRLSFPWPGRRASASALETAAAALRIDAKTYADLVLLWERLAALEEEDVEALRHVPAVEALARLRVPPEVAEAFLRNVMMFGTYAPASASMAECIRLHRRTPGERRGRPECAGANAEGGVRAIVSSLREAAEAAGVEIRLGSRVEQILLAAGRARGVAVRDARATPVRIEADAVVANVPIWELLSIASADVFPPALAESARSWRAVGGVVAAAFAFDGLPRLRETGEPDRFLGWTRLLTGPDASFGGGFLWSSHHSPRNAPEGKHVLQAMRLTAHEETADPRRALEILASFTAMLDEIFLDARHRRLWQRSWVTHDGTEYLVGAGPRPPVRIPGVDGLYLVGETTDVPAIQMDAAALSALQCAETISRGVA
ncbi:MAG: NAD(P)/FAD-dependent oxidoreductase [Deltaproteobacteria bacterium]|nr:NAD(P)/FAD-dependent oxidoreductase [Deltaproteobacteria bacterium]